MNEPDEPCHILGSPFVRLSMNNTHDSDVVVVGSGLAGLTAAALVAKAGKSVTVYESRSTVGGQARSSTHNGFTFNRGPHALYLGGAAQRVLKLLGVRLAGGQPSVDGKFAFGGQLEVAPTGPMSLVRTGALSPKGKLSIAKLLARLPKLDPADYAGVTVSEWIARSVNSEREADLLHALVRLGTYVNEPTLLSADVAISQLQMALATGVMYLDHGWQSLVDQLRATPGVTFETGVMIDHLPDARSVVIATGGPDSSGRLLDRTFEVGPPATASCLDLGLATPPEHHFVLGGDAPFYFSNHSAVARLAPAGRHHAAAVQYLGASDEPDPDAIAAFATLAGAHDIVESRRLHRMTTVTAISTAALGGLQARPTVTDTGHDNVFLAGDWVGAEGHLADASIASAEVAAAAALRR